MTLLTQYTSWHFSWIMLLFFCGSMAPAKVMCNGTPPLLLEVHDFHISKTRLEYSAERGEWQLSLHLFIDDLELALTKSTEEKLFLGTEREVAEADSLIKLYLQEKIEIIANGQALELQWMGKEVTDDLSAFWIYLYVPDAAIPHELAVSNRILLEHFDDQQNIVQLIDAKRHNTHLLFHRDHQRENIQF